VGKSLTFSLEVRDLRLRQPSLSIAKANVIKQLEIFNSIWSYFPPHFICAKENDGEQ
jgi:hypothetical protein